MLWFRSILCFATACIISLGSDAAAQVVPQTQPLVLKTAGQVYRLTSSVRFPGSGVYIAAPNVTLDLNGHTIYFGGNGGADAHGVVNYVQGYHPEISIPGASEPLNPKIINGSIVHEGSGATSHGIYGRRAYDALIENVRVIVNGTDSHSIYFQYYNWTLRNCVLTSNANSSFDRHAGPANVYAGEKLTATGNVLFGGNSTFNVGSNSVITKNVMAHNGHVTNGYGVFLYRNENVTVSDNIIIPSNGRGVILNAGNGHQILNNVILHLERPNAEFGDSLNPPAFRGRYDLFNSVFRGNTTLGIAGGTRTAASGIYLTEDGQGVNTYENNTLTTILTSTPSYYHYAQPLTMENQGYQQPSRSIIRNNVMRSNYSLIRVSGYDGSAIGQDPIIGNSLSYVDGNTARTDFVAAMRAKLQAIGLSGNPDALTAVQQAETLMNTLLTNVPLQASRSLWYSMYYHGNSSVTLLNTNWGAGIARDSEQHLSLYTGKIALRVGDTIRARLENSAGAPLANTNVVVTTDRQDTYSLRTDAAGHVDVPVIELGLDKAEPADSPIVPNLRASTTLTIAGASPRTVSNATLRAAFGTGYTFRFGTAADNVPPSPPSGFRAS